MSAIGAQVAPMFHAKASKSIGQTSEPMPLLSQSNVLKKKKGIVGKSCDPRVWHHIPNTGTLFQVLSWQEITVWIKEEIQGSSQCIIGKGVTSPGIMVIPGP